MNRWNQRRQPVERPEFPKLVAIAGPVADAAALLSTLRAIDPEAELVDGGERGVFARVHNADAMAEAKRHGDARRFPLAPPRRASPYA